MPLPKSPLCQHVAQFANVDKLVGMNESAEMVVPLSETAGGWRQEAPQALGVNRDKLEDALAYHQHHPSATANNGGALVIIYKGHLIAEQYVTGQLAGPQPWTVRTCNDVKSATKSVFGTAAGLFLHEYRNQFNLDTPLVGDSAANSLIPQIWEQPLTDQAKARIKIRHLLSMTSGHETPEPWLAPTARHHFPGYGGSQQMYEYCFGWWHFAGVRHQHTLLFTPGTAFNYSNYGLELMALAMRNVSGEEVNEYLYKRVLQPMGLPAGFLTNSYPHMPYTDHNEWNYGDEPGWGRGGSTGCNAYGADGTKSPVGFNSVVGSTFRCTARDFARLGYLWLHHGRWGDQQLVPAPWLNLATKRYRREDGSQPSNYGYTFWVQDEWAGVPEDTFMARGHNLNDCYIIPSLELVVARQGNANPDRATANQFSHNLIRQIVAAMPTA